ncbi:MAG TPA: PIN domain-containing protein [Terriglobales bacterium]
MRRVLVDSGPIVAILNRRDQYHRICTEALHAMPGPLFTCWPVITEAAWLLGQSRDGDVGLQRLLDSIESGFLSLLGLASEDAEPMALLVKKYRNIQIQVADAAMVHLAARDGFDTVFTLDYRDFSVYRLPKGRTFRVLPIRS